MSVLEVELILFGFIEFSLLYAENNVHSAHRKHLWPCMCKTQDTRPNKIHRKHTPVEHTNALKSELNRNQDAMNICETYRICCC